MIRDADWVPLTKRIWNQLQRAQVALWQL